MRFRWVIRGELARGQRPGFSKSWTHQVQKSAVDKWIKRAMKTLRIRSVICLLDDKHLRLYDELDRGLMPYYRKSGLCVAHVPLRLEPHIVLNSEQRDKIWRAYQTLPKPILVHCSAGRTRSVRAISHIRRELKRSLSQRTA